MKPLSFLKIRSLIIITFLILQNLLLVYPQCYIVASEEHKEIMLREWDEIVPDRQGNFASYDECEAYLNSAIADPIQRARHWCECEESYNTESYETQLQDESTFHYESHESQLDKIRLYEEAERKKRHIADQKAFNENKKDVLGKLKQNKALDQLKTTSDLSIKGQQNVNNNINDESRKDSESAFSEGNLTHNNVNTSNEKIPVSPPAPIDHQKNLFDYINRETKKIQSKILDIKEEQIQILDKKMPISLKIYDLKLNIEDLKLKRMEAKEETKVEEIDSLLLAALQMLEESEQLNEKAAEELKEKDKLVQENEGLLNKFQDTYTRSKEHPEESEQLLKELRGDN